MADKTRKLIALQEKKKKLSEEENRLLQGITPTAVPFSFNETF